MSNQRSYQFFIVTIIIVINVITAVVLILIVNVKVPRFVFLCRLVISPLSWSLRLL